MPAMPITRRGFLAAGTALGLSLTVVPPAEARTTAFGGLAFGGTWRVVGSDDLNEQALRAPIEAVLASIDQDMSPWRGDSAVSRFNTSPHTGWHSASQDLCTVVGESLAIAQLTDGAFDPTIGPTVARFGFGPITEGGGNISDLTLGDGQIGKADPRLTLDLCGIAKGYALDRIIGVLRAGGVTNALVELGGEIAALGIHPDGRPWQVAIERPQGRGTVCPAHRRARRSVTCHLRAQPERLSRPDRAHPSDRPGEPPPGR
jgi:thiamine biosynthesis lipoprotein